MSKDTRTALVPLSCYDINAISKAMHLVWLEGDYNTHGALDRILQRYFPAMEKVIEQAEIAAIESDNYPSIHDDVRDSIAAHKGPD